MRERERDKYDIAPSKILRVGLSTRALHDEITNLVLQIITNGFNSHMMRQTIDPEPHLIWT